MLLEQKNDAFHQTLNRLDSRMDRIESKLDRIDAKIDSNFKWLLGVIIPGLSATFAIMTHGFHWF